MSGRQFSSRYSLDVQINSSHNALLWRAIDRSLNRVVCIVLLPHDDERAIPLLELAGAAAVNDGRGAVAILDIVKEDFVQGVRAIDETKPYLGVVTEWVEGKTIDHIMAHSNEPIDQKTALRIITRVTQAVGAMHELGVVHGRLRPRNVYLNEANEVRVSGFGIDRALFQADGDTVATDIAGIGDLLFAMLSATWPHGSVGSLPAAEILETRTLTLPSQMRGGIPTAIDDLYQQTQDGSIKDTDELLQAISLTQASAIDELRTTVQRWTELDVVWHGKDIKESHRIRYSLIAFVAVFVFGWVGWELMTVNLHSSNAIAPSPIASATQILPSISPTALPSSSASPSTTESPSPSPSQSWPSVLSTPIAAIDYDPFGDGGENPKLAKLAIDGDLATAWTTTRYYRADFGKKPGVGLVLDLGKSINMKSVTVSFTVPGHNATVFVSDDAKPDIRTSSVLGLVSNSGTIHQFVAPSPVAGQYVLVWLTKLPRLDNGAYVGGIAEVAIGLN